MTKRWTISTFKRSQTNASSSQHYHLIDGAGAKVQETEAVVMKVAPDRKKWNSFRTLTIIAWCARTTRRSV